MNRIAKIGLFMLIAPIAGSLPGEAAKLDAPLPANSYIEFGGLDWAWAFPLPASSGLDLTYQAQFGWRLPTETELQGSPLATDFLFSGGNVPYGGTDPVSGAEFHAMNSDYTGDGACATPYFSNSYSHCDWQDGKGQPEGPWAGEPGAASYADQLVVRSDVSPVPLPASAPLFGVALLALGAAGYGLKRVKAVSAV